ncbi:MAG: hypothetical protein WC475_03480 [Candidatus Paceibacterota bacterium]
MTEIPADFLRAAKRIPDLEKVIRRELNPDIEGVSREILCVEIDEKMQIASLIMKEIRDDRRTLETHYNKLVGVFYRGSYNYRTFNYACADETITNPECNFTKITAVGIPYAHRGRSVILSVGVESSEGESKVFEISIQK